MSKSSQKHLCKSSIILVWKGCLLKKICDLLPPKPSHTPLLGHKNKEVHAIKRLVINWHLSLWHFKDVSLDFMFSSEVVYEKFGRGPAAETWSYARKKKTGLSRTLGVPPISGEINLEHKMQWSLENKVPQRGEDCLVACRGAWWSDVGVNRAVSDSAVCIYVTRLRWRSALRWTDKAPQRCSTKCPTASPTPPSLPAPSPSAAGACSPPAPHPSTAPSNHRCVCLCVPEWAKGSVHKPILTHNHFLYFESTDFPTDS